LNRIKANQRRKKKEKKEKKRKKKNIVEPKNAAVPEGDDLFCLFSLSGCCCHCRQEGRRRRIGRSFIPHLVHYSFLPLHGQTTFREKGGSQPRAYIFLLHHCWRAQLSAQSSLHYYYYLTTMSVIRFSEGREEKRKKKLDLTCSPFFFSFSRKPSSII
jgi:hypothetical protein